MKIPSSYTNLSGTHEVRAEQVPILETFKAEGPAVDLEKDLSPVSALDS